MTVRALDWVMTCKAVLSSTFLHQGRMLITPRCITRLVAGMVTIVTYVVLRMAGDTSRFAQAVDLLRVGFLPVITVWHFRTVTTEAGKHARFGYVVRLMCRNLMATLTLEALVQMHRVTEVAGEYCAIFEEDIEITVAICTYLELFRHRSHRLRTAGGSICLSFSTLGVACGLSAIYCVPRFGRPRGLCTLSGVVGRLTAYRRERTNDQYAGNKSSQYNPIPLITHLFTSSL